jgi:hypothetical protein
MPQNIREVELKGYEQYRFVCAVFLTNMSLLLRMDPIIQYEKEEDAKDTST